MFQKATKNLFDNKALFPNVSEYEVFEVHRLKTNLKRINILLIILFLVDLILISVDLLIYNNAMKSNVGYFYLYVSHLVILGVDILWFIYYFFFLDKSSLFCKRLLSFSFSYIILLWCVFMSVNNLTMAGQISAYIIIILLHASIIFLPPLTSLLTYFSSFILFLIGLNLISLKVEVKVSCIVNSSIATIFAAIVSIIIYKSFIKGYLNNKESIESNIKLKEIEKSRTDFFANISHELKTPLNIIYTAQQMIDLTIKNDKYFNNNVEKYIGMIKQNAFRLTRLVSNLIDITKIDACSFEVKPINADIIKIVEDITLSVSEYAENQGISLVFDTNVEENVIACDPDKIERIMLNLLSNAIKFTEKDGYIYVVISSEKDKVSITVADSGAGIPANMLDAIFDRFVQADKAHIRKGQGSGIGLALVKSLVELHDGTISVRSNLGEGSEFTITLPNKTIKNADSLPNDSNLLSTSVERINIEFSDIYS